MPHFMTPDGRLHFLDDDVDRNTVLSFPLDANQITDAEADAIRSASSQVGESTARRFSTLDFLDFFSESEQLAIVEASMQSAQIKLWYDRTLAASFVTIDDERVGAGLDALVAADLITAARRDEIVAAMSA